MFNMPQRAPHRFVGRSELLEKLSSKLELSENQERLALYGLSGIGKSCVAVEFAIRHYQKNPQTWILWLDGTTESTFLRDYCGIAEHVKLSCSGESPESQVLVIREWLDTKQSGNWLMIVDNVDDGVLLDGKKPLIDTIASNPNGSVIFTTRNKQIAAKLAPTTKIIQIPSLDVHEGLNFLGDFFEPVQPAQKDLVAAEKLLGLLEYQPLAIRCAGSFIYSHSMSISSYLELYNASEQEKLRLLSNEQISGGPTMPFSAVLIFMMSFDEIKRKNQRAAGILSFMGCISTRDIRRCLLPSGNDINCATKMAMATALGILKAYSLITADSKDQCFCMHSLVHLSIRHWMRSNGEFEYWIREALLSLAGCFPSNPDIELGNLPLCDVYLPHVEAVLSNSEFSSGDNGLRCSLSHRLSRYFQIRGRANKAEEFAASAAELCSDDFTEASIKREAYASVLRDNGKYCEALEIEQRVLKDRLEMLGDNHEAVLSSRNNIALSLQCLGDYPQAEEMHRFVLTQRVLILGNNHADTMSSLNNMSYVLQQQKKYLAAEQMAEEAVKAKRRVYGRYHFSTLQSMSSLAIVLQEQGKVDRAHEIHNQVLQGRERMLGKNHPLVLKTITNMVGTLVQQGSLEASEYMARDVLERMTQVRGAHHPDVLLVKHNLAWILFQRKKNEESEDLARQTLRDRINIFGNSHPATASTQDLLDELLQIEEERLTFSTKPTTQQQGKIQT
ncbi:P-loop containing nucleoside triphosphate hydrolase protein [Leptodontidium sp. MPI-SDFR-AT-0119]|nr:P-loop containing nucleoside triphosphate hydrolase protein [Leptodontidium sp. MPI-SDFR-AT-0119]